MSAGPSLPIRSAASPTWKRLTALERATVLQQRRRARELGLQLRSTTPTPRLPLELGIRDLSVLFGDMTETMEPEYVEMAAQAVAAVASIGTEMSRDGIQVVRAMQVVNWQHQEKGAPLALPPEAVARYLSMDGDSCLATYEDCSECQYRAPAERRTYLAQPAGQPYEAPVAVCLFCGAPTKPVGQPFRSFYEAMKRDIDTLQEEYARWVK